jgi:hypothetical protein
LPNFVAYPHRTTRYPMSQILRMETKLVRWWVGGIWALWAMLPFQEIASPSPKAAHKHRGRREETGIPPFIYNTVSQPPGPTKVMIRGSPVLAGRVITGRWPTVCSLPRSSSFLLRPALLHLRQRPTFTLAREDKPSFLVSTPQSRT